MQNVYKTKKCDICNKIRRTSQNISTIPESSTFCMSVSMPPIPFDLCHGTSIALSTAIASGAKVYS